MAITITLVHQTANWLRYLVAISGGGPLTANITSTGAATPDLQTDSIPGPLKNLSKVVANGFGAFAAGAQTQAQARALWLSDWSGADPGNANTTTARCRITRRVGVDAALQIDANVDTGSPILVITGVHTTGGEFYVDVEVPQAAGGSS